MSLITFDYFLGTFLTNVLNGEIKVLKHKLMSIVLKFVSTPLLIHVAQNVPKVDIPAQWKDADCVHFCVDWVFWYFQITYTAPIPAL